MNQKSQRGSTALATLASVMGGVVFLMMMLDLSRYVAAKSALQEAVRATARCLFPSDAACRQGSGNPNGLPRQWFGYPVQDVIDVYGREANYSAEIPQTDYQGQLAGYQVLSTRQQVQWNEYRVPVQRYVGLLSSWANLRVDVAVNYKGPDGIARECLFPKYAEIPWGVDFSSPAAYLDRRWCAGITPLVVSTQCAPGLVVSIEPKPEWGGSDCSIVLPSRPGNSGTIEWSLLGGHPVCDQDVVNLPATIAAGAQPLVQLNAPVPVSAPWGSAQPGDQGRPYPVTQWRQYLVVEAVTCNPLALLSEVEQSLHTRAPDTAERQQIAEIKAVSQFFNAEPYAFPGQPEFGSDFNNRIDPVTGRPITLGLDSWFITKLSDSTSGALKAIVPNYGWTYFTWERFTDDNPNDPNARRTFLHRKICGWKTWEDARASGWSDLENTPEPRVFSVAQIPAGCGTLVQPDPRFTCTNRSYQNPAGNPSLDCAGWAAAEAAQEATYQANIGKIQAFNNQPNFQSFRSLAPAGSFGSDLRGRYASEELDPNWDFAWLPFDEQHLPIPNARVTDGPNIAVSILEPNRKGQYKGPSDEQWLNELRQKNSSNLGWEQLKGRLRSRLAIDTVSATPISYPNVHPAPLQGELPLQKQGLEFAIGGASGRTYDENFDCVHEPSCDGSDQEYGSLEEAFRKVASERYGDERATDASLDFRYSAEVNAGYSLLGSFSPDVVGDNLRDKIPLCTPLVTSCKQLKDTENASPQEIGISSSMPASCQDGTFTGCYSLPTNDVVPDVPPTDVINVELARSRGFEELQKIFPDASFAEDCVGPGCAQIDIDQSDQRMVRVRVRYELPIRAPFSDILGSPSIGVESSAEEYVEARLLGR